MWKFQHPEGQREINTLHVPAGQPVKLLMISEDVIHSFLRAGVPRSHGRAARPVHIRLVRGDAARRRTTCFARSTAAPTTPAWLGTVIVMEPADYQRWLT